jgi:hypothetical protein
MLLARRPVDEPVAVVPAAVDARHVPTMADALHAGFRCLKTKELACGRQAPQHCPRRATVGAWPTLFASLCAAAQHSGPASVYCGSYHEYVASVLTGGSPTCSVTSRCEISSMLRKSPVYCRTSPLSLM